MTTLATSTIVLGPELAGIALTPEEFDAVDEADQNYRYEPHPAFTRLRVAPDPIAGQG